MPSFKFKLGNANYYSSLYSNSIFKIENGTLYRYISDVHEVEGGYSARYSRVNSSNNISNPALVTSATEQGIMEFATRQNNEIANSIEKAGYLKPNVNNTFIGAYEGTFEELIKLDLSQTSQDPPIQDGPSIEALTIDETPTKKVRKRKKKSED